MGMLFQMICLTNLLLQKGARDRSFCRLAVAVHILQLKPELLRQSFLMFITCGHYASVTIDTQQNKKAFFKLSVLLNDRKKPMNEIREQKFGCGRAYCIAS
jgi:hypothetical protein